MAMVKTRKLTFSSHCVFLFRVEEKEAAVEAFGAYKLFVSS
jgi:hypothetical protein